MADASPRREEMRPNRPAGGEPPLAPAGRFAVRTALQIVLLLLGIAAAPWVLYRLQEVLLLLVLAVLVLRAIQDYYVYLKIVGRSRDLCV